MQLAKFFFLANMCFVPFVQQVQCIAALFVSFMYQVGGKIVGEADLVSSVLSIHP